MSNVKFSQLPNLGTPTAATIIPVVDGITNYTVTAANLQAFVNSTTGNVTAGNVTATGNVAGTYILGNGSLLTGLPATYGNANVAAYLPTYTGNLNSVTAVPGAAITGTVANAAYATTAGTATSAVTAGTVTTAAQANITSVGTLTSLTASGNITGSYFIGNGSQLTGVTATSSYGNANVAAYLPTYTGNLNSVTAVPGAAITGTVSAATSAVTAVTAGTVTTAAQPNITSVGTLTSVAVTGNISGGNVTSVGLLTGGNVLVNGANSQISLNGATRNIINFNTIGAAIPSTTSYSVGTKIVLYDNISVPGLTGYAIGIAPYTLWFGIDGSALSNFNWYSGTTPIANLTSSGDWSTIGNVTTPGNISASYYTGNGSLLTGVVASNVALISTGNNFANTAVGNGKMWINGGNAIGSLTPTSLADNMFLITNGTGNCYITLAPTGDIVINPATGANVLIGSGTKISSTNFEGGTITASAKINGLGTSGLNPPFNGAQYIPASGNAAGTIGDICWGTNYIYVCTATNTWKRVAITAF